MKVLNFLFGWVKKTDAPKVIKPEIFEDDFYEWSQKPYNVHWLAQERCT